MWLEVGKTEEGWLHLSGKGAAVFADKLSAAGARVWLEVGKTEDSYDGRIVNVW